MDLVSAAVLGVVEGLTEFLPVSSTGHLIVVSGWLGQQQDDLTKAFEVIIQLGAILAVAAGYREKFTPRHRDLWLKLGLAFLPIAAIGFLLRHQIVAMFWTPLVAAMFIAGGIVFLVLERFYKPEAAHVAEVEAVSWRQAALIGIAQAFALIPGTSRAGATIIGGLLVGLDRRTAAEFSFLLAVPVMLATSSYQMLSHYREFADGHLAALAVGFVTSFVVAYLSMRLLIRYLQSHSFVVFAVYRILFGTGLLLWHYGL
jgi:undecaprenyl-diphosphatase